LLQKYETLKSTGQENINKLQESLMAQKQIESAIIKVELWVKDAAGACSKDLVLDVSMEILNEKLKKYQNLIKSGQVQEESLQQISTDIDLLKPSLSNSDLLSIKEDFSNVKEQFERLFAEVQTRCERITEAYDNRSKFDAESRELARLVQQSQDELKQLNRGVGPKVEDAVDMQKRAQVSTINCWSEYKVNNFQGPYVLSRSIGFIKNFVSTF
jgi:hypothetical protein